MVWCHNRECWLRRSACEVLLYASKRQEKTSEVFKTSEVLDAGGEIQTVARKFILANCLNPEFMSAQWDMPEFSPG
ncbi:MAG TPA: hypothetical protein V6C57_24950 [Coleofasciculaceae cyanobacterium]